MVRITADHVGELGSKRFYGYGNLPVAKQAVLAVGAEIYAGEWGCSLRVVPREEFGATVATGFPTAHGVEEVASSHERPPA